MKSPWFCSELSENFHGNIGESNKQMEQGGIMVPKEGFLSKFFLVCNYSFSSCCGWKRIKRIHSEEIIRILDTDRDESVSK